MFIPPGLRLLSKPAKQLITGLSGALRAPPCLWENGTGFTFLLKEGGGGRGEGGREREGGVGELLACTTATTTPDPSPLCDLHCSSQQRQILSPLSRGQGSNPNPHGYQSGS